MYKRLSSLVLLLAMTAAACGTDTSDVGMATLDEPDGSDAAVASLDGSDGSATTVAADTSQSGNDFGGNDTADNLTENADPRGYSYDLAAGTNAYLTRADDADFDVLAATSFSFGGWVKHDTIAIVIC